MDLGMDDYGGLYLPEILGVGWIEDYQPETDEKRQPG